MLTAEQIAAVNARGRTIVSASAGSGKTTVMIHKLTCAIKDGEADLDSVLAVTFTKKAAAQMKDKLRKSLTEALKDADGEVKARIKAQIAKIPTAQISTIHSFCAKLLRTYFYAAGIDGGFDIMSDEDSSALDFKERALENVFERGYEEGDEKFLRLLKRFTKKRSDLNLKKLILEFHKKVRTIARYQDRLYDGKLYTYEGFCRVEECLNGILRQRAANLEEYISRREGEFEFNDHKEQYALIFGEMHAAVKGAASGCFKPFLPFTSTRKPSDTARDAEMGKAFKSFRDECAEAYSKLDFGFSDRVEELERFLESGKTAEAFAELVLKFDGEYFALKTAENKLDYNDLEHLTLRLLQDGGIRAEIAKSYTHIFVDEYQDVNPVQEEILSALGGREVFLVGDVKQAIYGFRGSKSQFFYDKFTGGAKSGMNALRLTGNFRSAPAILDFVNSVFGRVMTPEICGFDFADGHAMTAGRDFDGGVKIDLYSEAPSNGTLPGVYSVSGEAGSVPHTAEGLAALKIVEEELRGKICDTETGEIRPARAGDICILVRKNNSSSEGIVRALREAGYPVSGEKEGNICVLPEVKNMLDILSYINNGLQDIPLVTCLLSPIGRFTEDELSEIRLAYKGERGLDFCTCCARYASQFTGKLSAKLNTFFKNIEDLRALAEILPAGDLIMKISDDAGYTALYSADGGAKLKNLSRLAEEGESLSLPDFLLKIKAGGYNIPAPASSPSDSIKVMTMHGAKGLEFPIVILSDVCRTFRGKEVAEIFFDENYGFAPKCYDTQKMLAYPTVLRKLLKTLADAEGLKNELNLFYVACTRAQCRLRIISNAEFPTFSAVNAPYAKRYAEVLDISAYSPQFVGTEEFEAPAQELPATSSQAEEELLDGMKAAFMQKYAHAESVDLPVKCSASAILRENEEPYYAERTLYDEEEEGGAAERGTAYHRFLELCDFSQKDKNSIHMAILRFKEEGKMPEEQAALLNEDELKEILSMPVFESLAGYTTRREQEFLCRMCANEVPGAGFAADDYVLVQGAIDLLATKGDKAVIVDYKYSQKDDGALKATYIRQLQLYKKATSAILDIPPENIKTVIVNIRLLRQINL